MTNRKMEHFNCLVYIFTSVFQRILLYLFLNFLKCFLYGIDYCWDSTHILFIWNQLLKKVNTNFRDKKFMLF